MTAASPRVVLVTRKSDYEELIAHHATRGQAAFFLSNRGQRIEEAEHAHQRLQSAIDAVMKPLPTAWRTARVDRGDLDRFLFEPHDIVVAVGQDGLIANLAKYLSGQPVIGFNPMPDRYDGVLVRHAPETAPELLRAVSSGQAALESLSMVEASLDDGQTLLALNEIYVGHQSHQSARYRLRFGRTEERQSSSGLIVATGTGATGWARSIHQACRSTLALPEPTQAALHFLVREAFPSVNTGVTVTEGRMVAGSGLQIVSEMNSGGVIFGDGVESDHIEFSWGQVARIELAGRQLNVLAI